MVLQNFIVLEGIDGAGTTTQLDLIRKQPESADYFFTSEPTTAETGKFLRQMLKGDVKVTNETAAYLFAADRNEHVNGDLLTGDDRLLVKGIRQACSQGHIVISDRYFFSSLAYQSVNCNPEVSRNVNKFFPLPELLFYFEITPEQSLSRITGRGVREIYEKTEFLKTTVDAYHKVLDEYRKDSESQGMKIVVLDACRPKEEIHQIIWNEIQNLPINRK